MQQDEYTIVEECRNGNSEAFAILVERYKEMVYNAAFRMLGDSEAAYDISQESFISAYESLKAFRNDAKFSTWLYSITLNKCRDHLRCRRPHVPIDEMAELLPSGVSNPEDAVSRKQLDVTLQKALNTLPEDYREVIVLKHIEGLDYREMESILGVKANALKVRTYRAREMLKKILEKAGVAHNG